MAQEVPRSVIRVRDIEKMTAVTDEAILDEYGVSPEIDDDSESTAPSLEFRGSDELARAPSVGDFALAPSYEDEATAVSIEADAEAPLHEADAGAPSNEDEARAPSCDDEAWLEVRSTGVAVETGPYSGYRRKRAVRRLEEANAETSAWLTPGLGRAKKRNRSSEWIRPGKASRSAPRGGLPVGKACTDGLVQPEWTIDA